jgi:hypothetical protein
LTPLLVGVGLVFFIDPYYLFSRDFIFNEEKFDIGYGFDQGRRYKIFTYLNNPTDKIILGASEINIINERNIPEEGWHSLSYGGAPLQESLNMYWQIRKDHQLTKVIIAPEFIKYYLALSYDYSNFYYSNFNWASCQSEVAFKIYQKKYLYFTDKYTIKSTWAYLLNMFDTQVSRGKPEGSKADFWKQQIDYAKKVYAEDVYNSKRKDEIRRLFENIKEDAKNNAEIIIVIPVQHIDLLKLEYADTVFNTYLDYLMMLVDIFGSVHYLAYIDDVSKDENAFSDPFHCNQEKLYIDKLFKNDYHLVVNRDNTRDQLDSIRKFIIGYE